MNKNIPPFQMTFLETNEYRRFAELCDACRRYHYIGICSGPPGVGKTFSARQYAQWEQVERLLALKGAESPLREQVSSWQTVLYTPTVVCSPKQIEREIGAMQKWLRFYREEALHAEQGDTEWVQRVPPTEEAHFQRWCYQGQDSNIARGSLVILSLVTGSGLSVNLNNIDVSKAFSCFD